MNEQNNQAPIQADPADVNQNKVFAILAYFGILFFLPLVCCKDSPYGKFHANQGLLIFLLEIALTIAGIVLGFLPIIGGLISWLLRVGLLVLAILGIVSASRGEMKPLPLIGGITIIK